MGYKILKILNFLDESEIDYRLVSNHCCGYVFYFLDGTVYPRRYHDSSLENNEESKIICESVDNLLERSVHDQLVKDWKHRIESRTIKELFEDVEVYMTNTYSYSE